MGLTADKIKHQDAMPTLGSQVLRNISPTVSLKTYLYVSNTREDACKGLGIMAKKDENKNYKVIAENRRARFDYAIEDDIEVGIILQGSEVKSLRVNHSNIAESYAEVKEGELWLVNSYIAPYEQAKTWGHEERRRRKLLASKRELGKMWSATQRDGMTLVPIVLYFNHKGYVKLKLGIAKGKKNHDKRASEAKRDWGRQKQRLLRHGS